MMRTIFLAALLMSCTPQGKSTSPCYNICQELVQTCEFSAYPNFTSCEEGCLYYQEQAVDIEGQYSCIQEAQCNEFDVIDCENMYGVQSENE